MADLAEFLMISDLQRLTGEPAHVVNHALKRFGPEPHGRIGITRIWTAEQLPAIKASLAKTAANPGRSPFQKRKKQ